MPRKTTLPVYGHLRGRDLARVIIDGKHMYLGKYGSEVASSLLHEVWSRAPVLSVGTMTKPLIPRAEARECHGQADGKDPLPLTAAVAS